MLLLWLLGVGIGVVNACLLPDRLSTGAAGAAHPQAADLSADWQRGADDSPLPEAAPDCHHGTPGGDGPAPARSNCADFCGRAGTSLPSLKWAHDALQAPVLFAPTAPFAKLPSLAAGPTPLRAVHRDGALGPPIAIALLRLTL